MGDAYGEYKCPKRTTNEVYGMEIQTEFSLNNVNGVVSPSHNTVEPAFNGVQITNRCKRILNSVADKQINNGGVPKMEPTQTNPQPAEQVAPVNVQPTPTNTQEQGDDLKLDEGDLAIATEEEEKAADAPPANSKQRELGMDEMGAEWIPNPKVGETTEVLTVMKVLENKKIDAKRKDGQAFKTNLSNVDYKIDVHTDKGIFCPSCWEIWGKLKAAIRKSRDLGHTTGTAGVKFSVAHLVNGLYASKGADEVRKLLEQPNTPEGLAVAEAECAKAKEAQKLKKCYMLTLHLPDGKEVKY